MSERMFLNPYDGEIYPESWYQRENIDLSCAIEAVLIHGGLDAFYRTDVMQYVHSLIPGSRLVVMEGSGHLPAMTRPTEVAREIDRYFSERLA